MRATAFEFRHRVILLTAIVVIGFWSPGFDRKSVWMLTTGWLAHNRWLGIQAASLAVGEAAAGVAFLGAALRTWAVACLGTSVFLSEELSSKSLVVAGPFRHLRNPLCVGSELNLLGLAVFFPLPGAIFVVVASAFLLARMVAAEEHLLAAAAGYAEYAANVPRILPSLRPRIAASVNAPRWGQSLLGEVYCWGAALSMAALVPQFNTVLILKGVALSFGLALMVRGVWPAVTPETR